MKVILINGSPNKNGCTYTALKEVEEALNKNDIDTELIQIARKEYYGCTACGFCRKNKRCVFDDLVNELAEKLDEADGLVVGSPVYYAGPNGALLSVMDRLFYAHSKKLIRKPAAAVVSARRGGTTATFDRLNKYFSINQMPIVSSTYWNNVHGNTPDEVKKDLEGMEVMRNLGENMAWLLRCIQLGKEMKVKEPEIKRENFTNFIK